MPVERYFVEEPLQQGEQKWLLDTEFHHLAHVMRMRKGDEIELVNGQGALAQATIAEIRKDRALLEVATLTVAQARTPLLVLAQAFPKLNRLDFILEKGTELGVDEFWFFPGQQSIKKEITDNQLERFQALTIAAMKQCGRLFLPKVMVKPPIKKWTSLIGSAFFGDTEEGVPSFFQAWQQASLQSPVIFCVGPESGWSKEEIEMLKKMGAQGVKLHSNVLRTDTASLVALSLIEHWLYT